MEEIILDNMSKLTSPPSIEISIDKYSSFFDDEMNNNNNNSSIFNKNDRDILSLFFEDPIQSNEIFSNSKYWKIKQLFIATNTKLLSSGASERCFSAAKLVQTHLRNQLSDEHFEKLLLLRLNQDIFNEA
jgi:hypothetical protein